MKIDGGAMTKDKYTFKCSQCGKTIEAFEDEKPECCGKQMEIDLLSQCTSADHPEMARNVNDDEPCDDGRGKDK